MPMVRSVMPRYSKILTVPYVSQGDYDLSGDGTIVMDGYSVFGPLYWNETAYKK